MGVDKKILCWFACTLNLERFVIKKICGLNVCVSLFSYRPHHCVNNFHVFYFRGFGFLRKLSNHENYQIYAIMRIMCK